MTGDRSTSSHFGTSTWTTAARVPVTDQRPPACRNDTIIGNVVIGFETSSGLGG
ncbi:hypothetical protein OG205_09785 [Lentzea sp. NBC_00516]|uniref:Uncharacterized protein n=1 Tax=Lentzea sokolovensis TaxID=3095429 RepID=A0ABU4UPM2_9PSEU|nr:MULTISPECIES: hypothetical protein [unclassified Lentzea]MDX8141442.1 hypothetical protein [Lentzea sp. BCCO 10_0061]WUD27265.1 hypothetical protein OG205_09785 [Lentzea sp. NBC_00516]